MGKCCSNNEMKEDAANHQQVNDNNEKANIKSKIRKKFRDSNAYKYAIASSRMKGGDSSKSDSSELKSHSSESKSHSSESKIDSSESKSDSSESKIDSFESKIDSSSSSKTEEEHPSRNVQKCLRIHLTLITKQKIKNMCLRAEQT